MFGHGKERRGLGCLGMTSVMVLALGGCVTTSNPETVDKTWGLGNNRLIDAVRPVSATTAVSTKEGGKEGGTTQPASAAEKVVTEPLAATGPQSLVPGGGPAQAGNRIGNAVATTPQPEVLPDNLTDRALVLAARARLGGDTLTSAALYRQVLVERPRDFEATLGLAQVLLDTEDLEGARPLCSDLQQAAPQNDRVLAVMARYDIANGDLSTAAVRLALAASIAPTSRDVLLIQGVFEDMRGNHVEAQRLYGQILALNPTDLSAQTNMALSQLAANDAPGAARILEQVLAAGPAAPVAARHNLAMAYGMMNRESDARRLLSLDLSDSAIESNLKYYRWLRSRNLATTAMDSTRPVSGLSLPPAAPLGR